MVREEQLWLAVKDKGYHQEGPDCVANTVTAAAGKVVVVGSVHPKVI